MTRGWLAAMGVAMVLWPALGSAQARRDGRLLITVIDQGNGILPGAIVTVSGLDENTRATTIAPVPAALNGIATIAALVPGRYSVQASFDGFESGTLKDVRVRAGDNRHVIVLIIKRLQESVTVGQDRQTGAADRKSGVFGTALTREQIDALSDDPNEMQRQLQDMAGPGAVMRIDSFEGGNLPPKSQIKAIHITRDQFAAENHSAEGLFIDIITQPGLGPIRAGLNYTGHNTMMTSRNGLSSIKRADQAQNYGFNLGGGLIKNKASFGLGFRGLTSFDSPIVSVALPNGIQVDSATLRSPRDQQFFNANLDYAVTPDQTLRFSYNQNDFTSRNLGIGGFNEVDRAYDNDNHAHTFRVQEAGPLGRRFFTNTRLNIGWSDSGARSALEAPTIRVNDAFTSGGAQVAGGRHSRDLNLASDLDYVRGIHSFRTGTAIDVNWFRSDDTSNYLGTYTFENLDAYVAGRPRSFVKRTGDPNIAFHNLQAALYAQDDVRLRKGLTLTAGVRYEAQTHVGDYVNVGPRLGVTWAPFKNGKATLRGSWGLFYDWLATATYEQTVRVDGFRQQEIQILNPSYPETSPNGVATSITPVNRYVLSEALQNAGSNRSSAGIDYGVTPRLHLIGTYRYTRGLHLLRGANLNAPAGGVRPHPEFGNVIEVESDGSGRQHVLQLSAQTPPPPPVSSGPRWDWKRWGFFSSYTLTSNRNNTDGPFSTPATGALDDDWGTAIGSATHRLQAGFTSAALKSLTWQIDGQMASGTPYTVLTGFDDNGDLIFNDRPLGERRNAARGAAQVSFNLFAAYAFTFGPRIVTQPPLMLYGTPAGVSVSNFVPPPQGRYRISFNLNVANLTNHTNLFGYSGVLSSPLFGRATTALNPRRINAGIALGF